ncbi:MAG: hypothetical protein L6408_09760 [Nanoarchaeota archaeon]|nr:hypothetical protein [Nanoarchaeota archaeon]
MDEEMKSKKDILKELLLTEEDTIKKLKVIIDKTKNFVRLDQKTNKIVVSNEYSFSNPEKILLYLIGKYFSKELGLSENEGMDIRELEEESGIKKTTLSKPLGDLIYSGFVGQSNKKKYFIHHYHIEKTVKLLHEKFIENAPNAKGVQIKYRPISKSKATKKGEQNE